MRDHFRASAGLACRRARVCVPRSCRRRRCCGCSPLDGACIGVSAKPKAGVGPGAPAAVKRCRAVRPADDGAARRSRGRQQPDHEVERPRRLLVVGRGSQGVDDRDADDGAGRGRLGAGDAHDGHDRPGQGRGRVVGRPAGRELRERGDASTTRPSTRASRSRPRSAPDSARKVRFKIADMNTHKDAGICKACWNHFGKDLTLTTEWKEYRVTFSGADAGAGLGRSAPAAVTPEQAGRLNWRRRPRPDLRHLDRRRDVPRLRVWGPGRVPSPAMGTAGRARLRADGDRDVGLAPSLEAVELHALDAERAHRQAHVAALVRLVAVQPARDDELAVRDAALVDALECRLDAAGPRT